jgi:hypothetical protein
MAWSTIRKATDTEIQELNAAEEKIKAHYDVPDAAWDMSYWKKGYSRYDERWQQYDKAQSAYRRAVRKILGGSAEGIAYGYVGYHVN